MDQQKRKKCVRRWRNRQRNLASASANAQPGNRRDGLASDPTFTLESLEQRLLMSGTLPDTLDDGADPLAGLTVSSDWFTQVSTSEKQAGDDGTVDGSALLNSQTQIKTLEWEGDRYEAVADQWLVQLTAEGVNQVSGISSVNGLLGLGAYGGSVVEGLGLQGLVLINAAGSSSTDGFAEAILANSYVDSIAPNLVINANYTPNDTSFGSLWGLHNTGQSGGRADADIDAPEAWDVTTGSADVVVAVIDTGVDYHHKDLDDNMWVNPGEIAGDAIDNDGNGFVDDVHGWDFVNGDANPMDDNGHGTHVAGTIAAEGNNNQGVVGVTWNTSIMALKFLSSSGSGFLSHAVKAINYATMMRKDFGANVRATNNSWGGGGYFSSMYNAVKASNNAGIMFVAAAGNDSRNNDTSPQYPANYDLANVISVAATDRNDGLASFSNYGVNSVHLAAPGASIKSTLPGNSYGSYNGTSMATPHVTGVAALLWAHNPDLSVSDVKNAILNGVDSISSLGSKVNTGGRLNAKKAIDQVNGNPTPDRYEENDSAAQVAGKPAGVGSSANFGELLDQVTVNGLNTVDDADDWFRFEMNDEGTTSHFVRIDYNPGQGNINLEVYDADGTTLRGDSNGTDSDDKVSLNNFDAGVYYVRVWAVDDAVVTNYTLNIKPSVNLNDAYEDNDSRAIVDSLTAGADGSSNFGYVVGSRTVTELNTLSDSNDYYRFRTLDRAGKKDKVMIEFSHTDGDLDMAMYNEAGTLVGSSFSVGNRESIGMNGLPAGVYLVRIYGYRSAANPDYTLIINAPQGPKDTAGNDPAHAKKLKSLKKAKQFHELVGMGDISDYYRVQLKRGGRLNLDLTHATGPADMSLVNMDGQTIETVSNGADATASSMETIVEAGTYFVVVASNDQAPTNYTVTIRGQEGPKDRAGNSIERARKIKRVRSGRTVIRRDALGFGDTNDFYRFKLKKAADVTIDLNELTDNADLEVVDVDGNVIDSSSLAGTDAEQVTSRLDAGIYYLRVHTSNLDLLDYALNFTSVQFDGASQGTGLSLALQSAASTLQAQAQAPLRSALATLTPSTDTGLSVRILSPAGQTLNGTGDTLLQAADDTRDTPPALAA